MFEIVNTFKAFRKLQTDEQGVTALEYGLIAAVVGTAVVAFGGQFAGLFTQLFARITTALAPAGGG